MTARPASIAKISTPRLFGVVARERLFARLDENRGRSLIWISGPPGAGKTTLVASYIETRAVPTLWYQVDAGDADPANLFHYLALSASALTGDTGTPLPKLVAEHLANLPAFANTFFRELFTRLPTGLIVVLDNYQEAPTTSPLHDVIQAAVAEVPPESSIIVISRTEAPKPFARFTANGAMLGLHWNELRLTFDETKAIMSTRDVRDDWLVRALHQQSEGWAAGVTLMLERLRHANLDAGALPTDTREAVFDYFASLLFDQASETTRHNLLSIAFVPHTTAQMAIALTGRAQAGAMLDGLYLRHLFTDRRPGLEPVYQFHALFRDFLQRRAGDLLSPLDLIVLKKRCAELLEENGDTEAAMDLWIDVQEWVEVERLILREAKTLLDSGRRLTLERWIRRLPGSRLEDTPWLLYWMGMCLVQRAPEEALSALDAALVGCRETEDACCRIHCLTALIGAGSLSFQGMHRMDAWLDELLHEMQCGRLFVSPDLELKAWGALCMAFTYVRPWHPWALGSAQKLQTLLTNDPNPAVALSVMANGLAMSSQTGQFDCGDRIAAVAEQLLSTADASPADSVWAWMQIGYLRFAEARYAESLEALHKACKVATDNGLRSPFVHALMWRFMVEFRVSGWEVATATLEEIENLPFPAYATSEALLRVYQARREQFRGKHDAAVDLADASHHAILRAGSVYQEMLFGMIDGELWLDAGRIAQGRLAIARVRQILDRSPIFDCFRAALVFCESFLARAENDRETCLAKLRESLALARHGNRKFYLRYLECCMPPLFSLALEEGIEVDLVQEVIRLFRLPPPAHAPDLWPRPVRIRTLGGFEVLVNDEPPAFSRKLPKKTLALLKVLVANGGREVTEDHLCDSLWGDEEADAARQALSITVLRLRKLLGVSEAVLNQGGKVWLDRKLCWVDAWRFEELLEASAEEEDSGRALNLYAGAFLPDDEGESWSIAARERLRGKFVHALARHGRTLERADDNDGAMRLYQRGLDADLIIEGFHQGMMRCYRGLGRHTEAIAVYRRLRQTLSVVLGVAPSTESERLYRDILQEMPNAAPETSATVVALSDRTATRKAARSGR